jgi:hypothetical protein
MYEEFSTSQSLIQGRLIIVVVLLAMLSASVSSSKTSAKTYYVSTTGSDSNAGSVAAPWKSITHAGAVVHGGDIVVVKDGTYNLAAGGSVGGSLAGDWAIGSNGSAGHPITYMAQHKWQVKLIGHGTGAGSTVVGMHGGYNILKDFDITGSDAAGIILATAGTNASHNLAVGNYVHDIVAPCDSNGGSGINSGAGENYIGISHNDMIANFVVNVTTAGGSTCPVRTTVGIYEAVPYGTVANNIVINAGYAIQSWHAARNLIIFGNTELNSAKGIIVGAGDSPGGTNDNTLVQNNIAVNNSVAGIVEEKNTGVHNRYINNLVYGNRSNISLHNGIAASGTVIADPLFINNTGTAAGDYHLQSTSPAIRTGLALVGITSDYFGAARPQLGPTDIGAILDSATGVQHARISQAPLVRADKGLLEASDASLSRVIDDRRIVGLPIGVADNGSNFMQLVSLSG